MKLTTPTIGDGTRIFHFLIDTILIFIIAYVLHAWYNFYVFYWSWYPIRFGAFFFMTMWLYVFLFETLFLRTPAKWITGTKVLSESGKRPSLGQFFIRATIRTTIVSMFGLAWNGKPLHDSLSKTTLVSADTTLA